MTQSRAKRLAKRVIPSPAIRMIKQLRGVPGQVDASRPGNHAGQNRLDSDVDHLEDRLWLGYEDASSQRLNELAMAPEAGASVRARAALALGRWELAHGRFEPALKWLDLSRSAHGHVDPESTSLAADCLCQLDRGREALSRMAPLVHARSVEVSASIRAACARSMNEAPPGHGSGWLVGALNRSYLANGLVPVRRRDVSRPIGTDNLIAEAPQHEPADQAGLVTVIVPVRNAASTIETAVTSLTAQSWKNLEIIVVDDSSDDGTRDIVKVLMNKDPRISLVESQVGGGPYLSRNSGVATASGDLVTVHNPNEWSHPQRIELQATALASSPSLAAIGSHLLEIGHDLTHRPVPPKPRLSVLTESITSLMFRRAVFDQVGLWDEAPANADEEFMHRVRAWFGAESIDWVAPGTPISIVTGPTLSAGAPDPTTGTSESHILSVASRYREAFSWWHGSSEFPSSLPFVPGSAPRPFAAPAPAPRSQTEPVSLGLVIMGDLGATSASTDALLALADGHQGEVGALHIPSFQSSSRSMLPAVQSLAASGHLSTLGHGSVVHCRLLVVGSSVLGSPRFDHLPPLTADKAYAIAPQGTPATTMRLVQASDLEQWAGVPFEIVAADRARLVGAPR
jgi:hypothetical protein